MREREREREREFCDSVRFLQPHFWGATKLYVQFYREKKEGNKERERGFDTRKKSGGVRKEDICQFHRSRNIGTRLRPLIPPLPILPFISISNRQNSLSLSLSLSLYIYIYKYINKEEWVKFVIYIYFTHSEKQLKY